MADLTITEQFQRVVPIKIGETLCYPVFLCLHAKNPGHEQLKRDLQRYRSTYQVLRQLFVEGQNYAASDEWLHSKLFAEKTDGLRMMWEYTNMMFLSIPEETRPRYQRELEKIVELNGFHDKCNTLPIQEEKAIISLFRTAMNNDSFVEEFVNLQEQNATTVQPVIRNETITEQKDNMEVTTDLMLRELYVDPVEKFMDEFTGSATELRGLFRVHTSTAVDSNLQQIICSTAKEWFEKTEGKLNLFGLNFSQDEQISFWVNRTEETYRKLGMPLHVEGFIQNNDTKKQFNFLKSLDVVCRSTCTSPLCPEATSA